jgi:hypothetical protein
MIFNPNKLAFGRHESFGLRYGWITKGTQEFLKNPGVFEQDDATVTLGVGRNMVKSIKYWLQAAGILERFGYNDLQLTSIGKFLFGKNGVDQYLEDDTTLWILHWLISTNATTATVFFWFFNFFHKKDFYVEDVKNSLCIFLESNTEKKFAKKTLKNDIQVLLRMYTAHNTYKNNSFIIESPFSNLGLIHYFPKEKIYRSRLIKRINIPACVFGYALTNIFLKEETFEIPIEQLMYTRNGTCSLGSIFRISEEGFLYLIDELIDKYPGIFEYRDSAGLRQLYMLEKIDPFILLQKHYSE